MNVSTAIYYNRDPTETIVAYVIIGYIVVFFILISITGLLYTYYIPRPVIPDSRPPTPFCRPPSIVITPPIEEALSSIRSPSRSIRSNVTQTIQVRSALMSSNISQLLDVPDDNIPIYVDPRRLTI